MVAGDRLPDRIGIGILAKVFPPELVDRVVDEAGVREQRTRTLPARVVVYYLLAMVLFFQSGYGEVWNKLVAGLDWARRFRTRVSLGMQPSPAAITLARKRLGWQVMAALLEAVAGPLAGEEQDGALVAGMRLVAVDGMCLDLPDNEENGAEFGYPGNDGGRGPFPQIRVVGLAECGTRAVLGAATSPLATGEQPLARQLLPKLRPGDLLLADRNFLSHGLLADVLAAGVHVLWRAKSDVDLPVLQVLPDGTYLSRIADPAASRRLRRSSRRRYCRARHLCCGHPVDREGVMPLDEYKLPVTEGRFREQRAYLSPEAFADPGDGRDDPTDLIHRHLWMHLMDSPTDVLLQTTDHFGSTFRAMRSLSDMWISAITRCLPGRLRRVRGSAVHRCARLVPAGHLGPAERARSDDPRRPLRHPGRPGRIYSVERRHR